MMLWRRRFFHCPGSQVLRARSSQVILAQRGSRPLSKTLSFLYFRTLDVPRQKNLMLQIQKSSQLFLYVNHELLQQESGYSKNFCYLAIPCVQCGSKRLKWSDLCQLSFAVRDIVRGRTVNLSELDSDDESFNDAPGSSASRFSRTS